MNMMLLQFQNAARFVTMGVEAEASYRTTGGWYGFAGATYARVGSSEDDTTAVAYGSVANAPQVVAAAGASTPLIAERAHVSAELTYVGERPVRPDTDTGDPLAPAPQWLGVNLTVYMPNWRGFDATAGVRNLLGKRMAIVAPGDFDRFDSATMTTTTVTTVPGEGREVYVKVGYSY
jgi:outer membrane receptor protein involved in Fe transport